MSELAPPQTMTARRSDRIDGIVRLSEQVAKLQSQIRLEINVLTLEDTHFGFRKFVCDELALHLSESPRTALNLVEHAQRYAHYPSVVARVGTDGWTIRHADALLDELSGVELSRDSQAQIVAMVVAHPDARTPHQIRKATQAAIMLHDPDAAERRYDKAKDQRHTGTTAYADGAATFYATGTKSQIAAVTASLDALAGPTQPGDHRTLPQRRFDAFMDLLCGRTQPGQWQAFVLVTLATLEGDNQPAEIPGFGLITATETRELTAHASLRRIITDQHGNLININIDTHVHHPDNPTTDDATAERLLSLDEEPDEITGDYTDPDPDDLTWLTTHLNDTPEADEAAEAAHDEAVEETVAALTSNLEDALRQLLDQHQAPIIVGGGFGGRGGGGCGGGGFGGGENGRGFEVEVGTWTHQPPDPPADPPSGEGRPPPPAGPEPAPVVYDDELDLEPDPPTFSDRDWHDTNADRDPDDSCRPRPHYRREPPTPGGPPPRPASAWTLSGLTHARSTILSTPVDQRPLDSTSYGLPPRLARHVKTRDQTCTFPGCFRLAQACQNDHVTPYPHGPSSAHNIASECTHHHQAKHAIFTVRRDNTGTMHWTTPNGLTITRPVRPLLRGW